MRRSRQPNQHPDREQTPANAISGDPPIAVLSAAPTDSEALPENLARTLNQAEFLSAAHPDDLSFPWVDRTRGELVITVVSAAGREQAVSFQAEIPVRIELVKHSRNYLKHIMDSAIGSRGRAAVTVWSTFPDAANNRVILQVTSLPRPFLTHLARAYNPSALALVVAPRPQAHPQ